FRSRGASSARDGNGHRTAKVGRRADPGLRRAGGGPGSARGEFFLCARSSEPAAAVQSRQPGSASALQGEDQKRTARRRFGVPFLGQGEAPNWPAHGERCRRERTFSPVGSRGSRFNSLGECLFRFRVFFRLVECLNRKNTLSVNFQGVYFKITV